MHLLPHCSALPLHLRTAFPCAHVRIIWIHLFLTCLFYANIARYRRTLHWPLLHFACCGFHYTYICNALLLFPFCTVLLYIATTVWVTIVYVLWVPWSFCHPSLPVCTRGHHHYLSTATFTGSACHAACRACHTHQVHSCAGSPPACPHHAIHYHMPLYRARTPAAPAVTHTDGVP